MSVKLTVEGGKEFVRVYADKEEVLFGDKRYSAGREILRNIDPLHRDITCLPLGVRNRANFGQFDKCHGGLDNSNQGATKVQPRSLTMFSED